MRDLQRGLARLRRLTTTWGRIGSGLSLGVAVAGVVTAGLVAAGLAVVGVLGVSGISIPSVGG